MRALKEFFVDAFEERGDYSPGMDGEGKGGKAQDKVKREQLTPPKIRCRNASILTMEMIIC